MKYSFVLIAFNEQNTIAACIASILAQQQLGGQYEILVVDDGSTDDTRAIVATLAKQNKHITLVSDGRNHGRGYGRYQGVRHASGDYVIMVDTDILLPEDWLATCLKHSDAYDVVGGIAVPDGDAAYVYRRFKLRPKTVMGSTTITGNNGLYRRAIFDKVNFDPQLREGEDVDFNHRSQAAGFSSFCVPGLTVEHQEHKSFLRSMQWLYQSGVGATRQLFRFKQVRLPDLAFAATALSLVAAIGLLTIVGNPFGFVVPLAGITGTAFMHLRSKFELPLGQIASVLGALGVNSILITCYFAGRLAGPFVYAWNLRRSS